MTGKRKRQAESSFRAYADQNAPRTSAYPVIAPRRDQADRVQLPSIKDLELLKAGRGTYCRPEPSLEEFELIIENRPVAQYFICGKPYVMQEVVNEGRALHHRMTAGNRQLTYELSVEQGPKRARACGNGPRSSADRRPVDPPPVIRLRVLHGQDDITATYDATFMLFASLEHARPVAKGILYNTNHCPVLTGVCVAGAAYLTKPVTAAYFIFPDLSVRHEGWYRFKFHLFEQTKRREDFDVNRLPTSFGVGSENAPAPNDQETMVNMTSVYTEPFQVFSAKKFPGLQESTPLSKLISDQGCRVRIRREIRQRKGDARNAKKEERDQPPLRVAIHDRLDSIDSVDHWRRPGFDTRRPSVDSQVSTNYAPSQRPSYAQNTMMSPTALAQPGQYSQYDRRHSSVIVPESQDGWSRQSYSNSMPRANIALAPAPMAPPPMHRPSYPAISPAPSSSYQQQPSPSTKRPTIQSMISEVSVPTPSEPARPAGGFYKLPSPVARKRGASRSPELDAGLSSYTLKDGARPTTRKLPDFSFGTSFPLAGGNDMIEAEAEDARSDSDDSLLDLDTTKPMKYKRSTGQEGRVPPRSGRASAIGYNEGDSRL